MKWYLRKRTIFLSGKTSANGNPFLKIYSPIMGNKIYDAETGEYTETE